MSLFFRFLLGTLFGGGLGALIGLLMAPRSGAETRQLIKQEFDTRYSKRMSDAGSSVEQFKHKAVNAALNTADQLKHRALDTVDQAADSLKTRVREVSDALESTGRQVTENHVAGES